MSKQGTRELDRLIQKKLIAEAIKQRSGSAILTPDAAKANVQAMYEGQFKPLWNLREQLVSSALNGGQLPSAETLDACDTLALALMKVRCEECLKLAKLTDIQPEHAFLFAAEAFGVDVSEWLKEKPEPSTNKLVSAH